MKESCVRCAAGPYMTAKAVMVLGTTSGAGKSWLTIALSVGELQHGG